MIYIALLVLKINWFVKELIKDFLVWYLYLINIYHFIFNNENRVVIFLKKNIKKCWQREYLML